jgi:hypothetical protein
MSFILQAAFWDSRRVGATGWSLSIVATVGHRRF